MSDKTDLPRHIDTATIEAAQQDPADFEQVYRAFVQPIFRYLYSHTGNRQDAEELTAQTFLSAFERLPRYSHNGHFPAWLFAIARNKAVDLFRKRRRLPEMDLSEDFPSDNDTPQDVMKAGQVRSVAAAIQSLPEAQKELLRLRFVADLSFAEIAVLQGRKQDAVKKTIYRLLARLHSLVEPE